MILMLPHLAVGNSYPADKADSAQPGGVPLRYFFMKRAEKEQVVGSLEQQLGSINSAFLIDFRGLKVVDATELRRKIREIDGHYVVVKNTLVMRAAKKTQLEQLTPYFQGPTAVAYHHKDVVGLAKLLTEISKTNPNIAFKAALVEGKVILPSEIQMIASLPSREVMLSRLTFLLKAPLQQLVTVMKAPVRDLVLALKQVKK